MSTGAPRLTIGLPTYNGEAYLGDSVDALLAQTFGDFELIIADNASTDGTEDIARAYAAADDRVRYLRQPVNIGAVPNHNQCIDLARGDLFKWASDDDVYAHELLEQCVTALDERPEIVLAHSWTAYVDEQGVVTDAPAYPLDTDRPDAPARFRSLLFTSGGDDIYGVIRMGALARLRHGTYHQADRVFTGALSLWGPFHQVPDHLYFRRDLPTRTSRVPIREQVVRYDPRRTGRWRQCSARLAAEYVGGYIAAIGGAPISAADRARCMAHLSSWVADRLGRRTVGAR